MVFTIGVDSARALAEIEAGTADYAVDGLPRDAGAAGSSRSTDRAARRPGAGHQQYFISPANGVRVLHMNTQQAAVLRCPAAARGQLRDRPAGAGRPGPALRRGQSLQRRKPGRQLHAARHRRRRRLPSLPADRPGPSPGTAARRKRPRDSDHVHARLAPWLQEAQIIRRDLQPLGIDVQVKEFPLDEFYDLISQPRRAIRSRGLRMVRQHHRPRGRTSRSSTAARSARTTTENLSYFNDPAFDRQLHAAAALSGARRYRTYRQLDLELERDLAPAAAFATTASRDFFSARMGCQLYQPVYGIDLAALCLRSTGS